MKKGFLGFLTGTLLGGLTAILTSKHSGKEVRTNLKRAWTDGKTGGKVVMDEVKDVADELKKGLEDFARSEKGQALKENVQKSFETVKGKVMEFVDEAKAEVTAVTEQLTETTVAKKKAPARSAARKKPSSVAKKSPSRSPAAAKKAVAKKPASAKKVPVRSA